MQGHCQKISCLLFRIGMIGTIFFAVLTFEAAIPDQMYVTVGNEVSYDFGVPVSVVLKQNDSEVFSNSSDMVFDTGEQDAVSYTVTCKLFGLIPVKDVDVTLVEDDIVYTGGGTIGIYVETNGVMVIGTGEVTAIDGSNQCPAEHLVKAGDYIETVNGETVTSKEELVEKINQYGAQREVFGIRREEELIEVAVLPIQTESGEYKAGIWVRDDLAGVGTLTYYTADGEYGALGHGVSDADTGLLMDIEDGWIYQADIVGITKGTSGTPGEISGIIDYGSNSCLGTIDWNENIGIHGLLEGDMTSLGISSCVQIAYKQDIEYGEAYLISGISGENKEYKIQIENIDYSETEENKGIMFEVKDPDLLELTGGIVQGMSGSPIIQNGKLIGAVTHVFVNDPTKGYGIFIETMIE